MTSPQVYVFDHFATTEASEHWLSEITVDFTAFDAVQFSASLEAVTRGVGGDFSVRMGGTSRRPDGVQIVRLPGAVSPSWVEDISFVQRVVTRGAQLFKLTATSATQDEVAEINAGSFTLWAESTAVPLVFKVSGVDIWMGDSAGDGVPDFTVTPARDWQLVAGREAFKQSLRRRFLTSPGEYKTKPNYGAGLRASVKRRGRSADLDQISNALRAQALQDARTSEVVSVKVDRIGSYGVKYSIVVRMKGDDGSDVSVTDTVPGDEG